MSDFIVNELDESLINLKDGNGKTIGSVEAVDVIDFWVSARHVAAENGNKDDWFMYFQGDFKKATGVTLSKTNAVMLYRHACEVVESLKKSGFDESERFEPLDTAPTSPKET